MLVEQIRTIAGVMRELITKYGRMKPEVFDRPFKYLDELDDNQLAELYDWLLTYRANEYQKMYEVFRLPLDNSTNGPELWDRYFAAKKYNFVEMVMLREAARTAKDKWKTIPKFKVKDGEAQENADKDSHREDSPGVDLQPQGQGTVQNSA